MKAPIRIQSAQNENFKHWRQCLTSKGIHKWHEFFIFGQKVILETLRARPEVCTGVIFAHGRPAREAHEAELRGLLERQEIATYDLDGELFDQLDEFGTHFPLLTVRTPEIPQWNPASTPSGLEVLVPLGDPANLGALIRTAAAFSIPHLVLLRESASPFHPKAVRAASGSLFQVQFSLGPSLDELAQSPASPGKNTFCLDLKGQSVHDLKWPRDSRLILGQEGPGLPSSVTERAQQIVIPQNPNVDSLNATVAASLALFSYRSQHRL